MNVTMTITGELEQFVSEKVNTGVFPDANALISAALETFRDQLSGGTENLRREIEIGLDQIERGDVAEWNTDELKKSLTAEFGRGQQP